MYDENNYVFMCRFNENTAGADLDQNLSDKSLFET